MKCGLLGRKLGHSYSPAIHCMLGDYSYGLYEVEPEELEGFLRCEDFAGLNVTMPYKEQIIPYLDALSDSARRLGAVNTIVRQPDGRLVGYNTDYAGFSYLLDQSGISVSGKKALVLGSGGAGKTVKAVLEDAGAQAVIISRTGESNYGNLELHSDAAVLVNATPVGMYPNNGCAPVDLQQFPRLEGVFDLIYNPARTALLLQAEALGVKAHGGLEMLVAQAWEASHLFTGKALSPARIRQICERIRKTAGNVILIGMPGCGKTTLGKHLAERLGRPFADTDVLIEAKAGLPIPDIFDKHGEEHFRTLETQILQEAGKQSGLVIACGGGVVTRAENYPLLHQNGVILWLRRPVERLPVEGRPLSQSGDLDAMSQARYPMYAHFADHILDIDLSPEAALQRILEVLQ